MAAFLLVPKRHPCINVVANTTINTRLSFISFHGYEQTTGLRKTGLNHQYKRSGTLWEGRYKSCLIEAENYLIEVYRYIELNPVRAKMVKDPSEYLWSSYQINVLGKLSELCTPHAEYLKLGQSEAERIENYRTLFAHHVEDKLLDEIRKNINRGMVLGRDRFKEEIEQLTGRRMKPNKAGRPVGWRKKT